LAELTFGGPKSGIIADPTRISKEEKLKLVKEAMERRNLLKALSP